MGDSEDEEAPPRLKAITPLDIRNSCIKNRLYTIPELNDTLYLHYGFYQQISSLEPYFNLTSLWLNNNSINVIDGLSSLKKLVCLYLQGNVIQRISGLDELVNLETLVLSSNYIKKIENLGKLVKLHTLELDRNYISDAANLAGILEVPALGVLNISHNALETEEFLPYITEVQTLNLLKLEGNPIARFMSQYRRRILNAMPELKYLDDQPVTEAEVRCAKAWARGGSAAEAQERQNIRDEKEAEWARHRRELRRINRKTAIDRGLDISQDKSLMSSDDERLNDDSDEEEPVADEDPDPDEPGPEWFIEVSDDEIEEDEEDYQRIENIGSIAIN
jgi:dynein assembly factor 1